MENPNLGFEFSNVSTWRIPVVNACDRESWQTRDVLTPGKGIVSGNKWFPCETSGVGSSQIRKRAAWAGSEFQYTFYHSKKAHVIMLMKNRFGSGSCFGLLSGSRRGGEGPDAAFPLLFTKIPHPALVTSIFFHRFPESPFSGSSWKYVVKRGLYAAKAVRFRLTLSGDSIAKRK